MGALGQRKTVRRASLGRALTRGLTLIAGFGISLVEHRELDCETAVRTAPSAIAAVVCRDEYERTQTPDAGIRLAQMMRETGNLEAAAGLANNLLATTARADALQLLGKIAFTHGRDADAETALEEARKLHRSANQQADLARDDHALARIFSDRGRFTEALMLLDECIGASEIARDRTVEGYCRLAAARVLSNVGYFELAQQELDRARSMATSDRDLAWLEFERGNLDQEISRSLLHGRHTARAIGAFERVLLYAARAQIPKLVRLAELNLTFSLAEAGRTDDAERHLLIAKSLDLDGKDADTHAILAARIAYHRKNFSLATSLNERVFPVLGPDNRIDVAAIQARIALAENQFDDAEQWARRGIAAAEEVRAAQTALELRPWVLASRREPYELLFVSLARAGRPEDALLALDRWHGRTTKDSLARPSDRVDLRGAAKRIERIGTWIPVVSDAPSAAPADASTLSTVRTLDLLALVIADSDVWVLTMAAGELRIRNLGPWTRFRRKVDELIMDPTNRVLATELGDVILRDGAGRTTRDVLHVLLDGPLVSIPIVAILHEGRPLIAARPIVRVARLPREACASVPRSPIATVLADPGADLPAARKEAIAVASTLAATTWVGNKATSKALFDAPRGGTLHVAVHTEIDAGGGVLKLHDRDVTALEIASRKLGPALVVLSSCGSAGAVDAESSGSLATAFLAAGSSQVVATLRPVSDAGALEIASRFYREGGVADPIRTLAKIQAELAETTNGDWPYFAVFGRDSCSTQNRGEP